jgi:signal transduction histidine kinase
MSILDQDVISKNSQLDKSRYNKMILHLTAYMLFMSVAYYIFNITFNFNAPWFVFAGLGLTALVSYSLFKLEKQLAAKSFGLLGFNFIVYLVASSETNQTNVNLYFATAGVAALVLFNRSEKPFAISSVSLSLFFYLFAKFSSYSPLPERIFTVEQTLLISIINLIVFVGVTAYLIFLLLDSNYRKQTELESQNSSLIKVNKELDRFIYSTSHDLRAPLSSLLGLIQLSELDKDASAREDYLRMMKTRIETMDLFIKDLIDYSKNIRQQVEAIEIGIRELVEDVKHDLKYINGAETLILEFKELAVPIITSDINRMKIVFSNLISNVIKYRDRRKAHTSLFIKSYADSKNIVIEFCDNGIGIPEEHLDKVFNMFHRAHEVSIGSGLGLYIVQETLATLNGSIKVSSKEGEESTFSLSLPS